MADEDINTDEDLEPITDFEDEFNKQAEKRDSLETNELDTDLDTPPGDELDPDKPKATDGEPGEGEGPGTGEEEDPYAGWPEEAKSKVLELQENQKKMEHEAKSDRGRISAFQNLLTNTREELNEAIKAKDSPSKQDITDAMGTDEDWENFTEEYPEIAKIIDKRMEATNKRIETVMDTHGKKIDNTLQPVIEREADNAMEEAYDVVAKEYPTWQDAVKEQAYSDWIVTQPAGVQNLAESADPADASALIGLFDTHRIANGLDSLKAQPEKSGDTDHESGSVVEKEASELEKRRQLQLESGATVESKAAKIGPNAESGEDEFERAFNAYAARKEAKRQA